MLTSELLIVEGNDWGNPVVLDRITTEGTIGDANITAKSLLANAAHRFSPAPNAYRIQDAGGKVKLESRDGDPAEAPQ